MGRGVARQARDRFPGLARELGQRISASGNHVHELSNNLLSFPTKTVWWLNSDLELIAQSATELRTIALAAPDTTFYLPRPGCSNGKLSWEEVKPVLEKVGLPDNVVCITNGS